MDAKVDMETHKADVVAGEGERRKEGRRRGAGRREGGGRGEEREERQTLILNTHTQELSIVSDCNGVRRYCNGAYTTKIGVRSRRISHHQWPCCSVRMNSSSDCLDHAAALWRERSHVNAL